MSKYERPETPWEIQSEEARRQVRAEKQAWWLRGAAAFARNMAVAAAVFGPMAGDPAAKSPEAPPATIESSAQDEPHIQRLKKFYLTLTSEAFRSRRPAIFKADTAAAERCREAVRILDGAGEGDIITVGLFLMENPDLTPVESMKKALNEHGAKLPRSSSDGSANKDARNHAIRSELATRKRQLQECGMLVRLFLGGKASKFEGEYATTTARLIENIIRAQATQVPGAKEAAHALDRIVGRMDI